MSSTPPESAKPYHMQYGSFSRPDNASIGSAYTSNDGPVHPDTKYASYKTNGKGMDSAARVNADGQIEICLDLKKELPELPVDYANPTNEYAIDQSSYTSAPPMSIVIMIVGSRGDVQPYIVLSKALQKHGHRVRLATHETFRGMVKDARVGFFNIGGDPAELMSYMVRNPGLLPGVESLLKGDIGQKRKMLAEILEGCWKACFEADEDGTPFVVNAIISNPPAFAHIHCAEALGIPLHMSFTMPWCSTRMFPHPLVKVSSSNAEPGLTNVLTYAMAELLQWQGLGDVINHFRVKTLGLQPLGLRGGATLIDRLRVPWTYCFSPTLIPMPHDWMNHIDISGFYFLEAAEGYVPDKALQDFIDAGESPIYIGFGSVVVKDPEEMTKTIFEAVQRCNVRAIVSAGWGGLGGTEVPPNVFILPGKSGVPHDWLFTKVFAVCHHGGAGTTAIGLLLGKPTIICPFFGDQPFWGRMVHNAGAGPKPIKPHRFRVDRLAAGIEFCKTQEAKDAAEAIGAKIRVENGPQRGVDSFHAHLPLLNMRCDLDPKRVAVWWSTEHSLKLSTFATRVLLEAKKLKESQLVPHRPREWHTQWEETDPLTGGVGPLFWTVSNTYEHLAKFFYNPKKGLVGTVVGVPMGFAKSLSSMQQGFSNVPRLYGQEVRKTKAITNFTTGLKEGGIGFYYSLYDSLTGLVTEPIAGAKKEGFKGAIIGTTRSLMDLTMRPVGGALGLVTHPTQGLYETIKKSLKKKPEAQTSPALQFEDGQDIRTISSVEERQSIIMAFNNLKGSTRERRATMIEEFRTYLRQDIRFEADPEGPRPMEQPGSLEAQPVASSSRQSFVEPPPPYRYPTPNMDDSSDEDDEYRSKKAGPSSSKHSTTH